MIADCRIGGIDETRISSDVNGFGYTSSLCDWKCHTEESTSMSKIQTEPGRSAFVRECHIDFISRLLHLYGITDDVDYVASRVCDDALGSMHCRWDSSINAMIESRDDSAVVS